MKLTDFTPKTTTYIAILSGPIVQTLTILTTYAIAVSLGHVPAFLPMISDCQVSPPEEYIARWGMPISTFCVQISLYFIYIWLTLDPKRRERTLYFWMDFALLIFGCFSLLGFYIVGAVSEDNDITLHSVGAVTGFWGLWVYGVLLWIRLCEARHRLKIGTYSLITKFILLLGVVTALTVFGIITVDNGKKDFTLIRTKVAICEWTAGFALDAFLVTMLWDVCVSLQLQGIHKDKMREYEPIA